MACGSVDGSAGRRSAEAFFAAAERGLIDPWDRFFLHLRWATVGLKRFEDADVFGAHVSAAHDAVADLDESGGGPDFARALTNNLLALGAIRLGELAKARQLADVAAGLMLGCRTPSTITPRVAARYRSTVMMNVAVVSGLGGDWVDAAARLETLLIDATSTDVDSVSEVLSVAGLAWVRALQPAKLCRYSSTPNEDWSVIFPFANFEKSEGSWQLPTLTPVRSRLRGGGWSDQTASSMPKPLYNVDTRR